MNQQETVLRTLFIILSVLTSFVFIFYGVNVIGSQAAPRWATTFAWVVAGYGVANIAILSLAWNSRDPRAVAVNKLIALCFFAVVVMDAFKSGFSGGRQVLAILALAGVLCGNWLAVRKVVNRPA